MAGVNGGVNSVSRLILETIQNHPGINAPTITNHLGISLRTTQRHLKQLTDDGQIKFSGASKNGGYYIIE